MKRLGFLVNPIAGMGGRVALKGTDGTDILKIARERGATPLAPLRASLALKSLLPHKDDFELLTGPADMGENEAKSLGFHPCVLGKTATTQSSPEDTRDIAQRMTAMGCELLLFAGGDGTARVSARTRLHWVSPPESKYTPPFLPHPQNRQEISPFSVFLKNSEAYVPD